MTFLVSDHGLNEMKGFQAPLVIFFKTLVTSITELTHFSESAETHLWPYSAKSFEPPLKKINTRPLLMIMLRVLKKLLCIKIIHHLFVYVVWMSHGNLLLATCNC